MDAKEWRKENEKRVSICFNKKTEEEILDFFQEKEDKTEYVRELVLEDIENDRDSADQI